MPSPVGGQWRLLRHYLAQAGLANKVQWENFLRRVEKTMASKMSARPELDSIKSDLLYPLDTMKHPPVLHSSTTVDKNTAEPAVKEEKVASVTEVVEERLGQPTISINSELKGLTVETLLEGIRLRRQLARGDITQERALPVVSKTSIHARTAYVISALVSAETKDSLLRRTDSFIQHLMQYPEARDLAIKEGGVRVLLRVQSGLDATPEDNQINGLVREALALLGHTGPCKGPGPNILSLDGGGIRGLIAIEMLKQLERLSGRKVNELFDYIVGVSTGAIIAAVLSSGMGNLDTASSLYHTLSKQMFGNTSVLSGTSRLVLTHSYYDTEAWERLLQERLKDTELTQCNRHDTPKMALVSCVVNAGRPSPFLFRSYEMPYRVRSVFPGTARARVWQAVRASAAAPTYFNEFRHEGLLHQDGGIMVNNPAGIALHEARLLYGPGALARGCVVSLGTGRVLGQPAGTAGRGGESSTSWKDKFNKILDSATDTEGVHLVLNDLLPEGSYFRLNPPLNSECAMDEVSPEKLQSLLVDTHAYMRRNRHKLQQAAAMLTRKRSLAQRLADSIHHQSIVLGVRQGY